MNERIVGTLYFRSFFSEEDCEKLIRFKNQNESSQLSIWTDQDHPVLDPNKRSGTTSFVNNLDLLSLKLEADLPALIKKLRQKYGLPFDPTNSSFQILEYKAGDHFDVWHTDNNDRLKRKLTMVCLLSKPDHFDGGELIFNQSNPRATELKQGDIIFFPSRLSHRVTKVTKGHRYTLVCWL